MGGGGCIQLADNPRPFGPPPSKEGGFAGAASFVNFGKGFIPRKYPRKERDTVDIRERLRMFLGAEPFSKIAGLAAGDFRQLTELRLRAGKPMLIKLAGQEYALANNGRVDAASPGVYHPTPADIAETIERISQYSFYAYEPELCLGYITLPGGHRVGVSGQAVIENGTVRAWRHISSINFRVAHGVIGCADAVLPLLYEAGRIMHTMIISPPGCGKTTLLRDIVRQISGGAGGKPGLTVGLVDERSEVAGCFKGIPQNDIGPRTDVLDGCPKAEGMVMLLRAMSPDVIAVDELGGKGDAVAAEAVLTAGVKLLCTAHGSGLDDIRKNPALEGLISRKIFRRYIVLSAPGQAEVLDGEGDAICCQA